MYYVSCCLLLVFKFYIRVRSTLYTKVKYKYESNEWIIALYDILNTLYSIIFIFINSIL